ncbi:hypothetical protein AALP_AA5G096000 [Arabis alpina]|uniref:Uncharacterized protein n=1 Tax=Arabis alpina TaxID=50452 RepID=A0A087GW01_ARAAL|nr:hypothetical protein AALP_AA5G096000 [Arabis alpina]
MSSSKFAIFCIVLVSLASLHECNFFTDMFKSDPIINPITGEKVKEPPCYPYGKRFRCTNVAGIFVVNSAEECWSFCARIHRRP